MEELYQALRNADAAGDTDAARRIAAHIIAQQQPTQQGPSEADRKLYDPTVGMSQFERGAAGLGKAASDAWLGIRSLTGNASPEEVADRRRLDAPLMDTAAGFGGNVLGQIGMALAPGGAVAGLGKAAGAAGLARTGNALSKAGAAAMAPNTIKGAAALGLGFGVAQPAVDGGERAVNALAGGAGGAGGQALFKGLAKVIRPEVGADVATLMKDGITPTPGQILGGGFKRVEEGMTSVPIVGDAIKGAQLRAVGDMNRAAINRALSPVGAKLPKGLTGRDAIAFANDELSKRYDALLPGTSTQADGQFMQEIISLRNMMGNGSIDPTKAAQFEALLNNQVLAKFQPGAGRSPTITGETMKAIESDLGQLAAKFQRSLDPDQNMVGDALQEVQAALRRNVERSNPAVANELKNINKGWANFKRVQRAASSVAAEDGVFSAAQLQSAVKAMDRSKDKSAFARGNALMQDLAEPSKSVLGPKVPDSGTPFRSLTALGASGAAGQFISPGAGVAVLAAPALYSKPGQAALAALLTRRPDAAAPIANALRRISPYAAVPAIGASTTERP